MDSCEQIITRKMTNPIWNFQIIELITDTIVNSTVDDKQLKTLSLVLCMDIKTLSLRVRQLISVSFGGVFRNTPHSLHPPGERIELLQLVFSS